MKNKISIDQIITLDIYGRPSRCRIFEIHPMGTLDVERLNDGQCFRVTGLDFYPENVEQNQTLRRFKP